MCFITNLTIIFPLEDISVEINIKTKPATFTFKTMMKSVWNISVHAIRHEFKCTNFKKVFFKIIFG